MALALMSSCMENKISPEETSKRVVESFYQKDNKELKKYTTDESYQAYLAIQNMLTNGEEKASNFKLIRDSINGNIAWVKFTTDYEEKPQILKLIQENGMWKVTESGVREKLPF